MESIFRSLSAHSVTVKASGEIVDVNDSWKNFGLVNGLRDFSRAFEGANYLEVCRRAADTSSDAQHALTGLIDVLHENAAQYEMSYPCHGGGEHRWFLMQVSPVKHDSGRVVVSHVNITAQKLKELAILKRLRSLASQLAMSEANARREISTKLHDHLQQLLVASQLKLRMIKDGHRVTETITQADDLLNQAIAYTRNLTADLSPPVLFTSGLGPALRWLAEQTTTRFHLPVHAQDESQNRYVPESLRVLLFESVRELLFNIVKHAQATHALITLRSQGRLLRLTVEDDGRGFDPAILEINGQTEHFGLFAIRERMGWINGRMEIESAPGQGTRITLVAPILENVH